MIRAILVDDEHIVRKGLLHILPWAKHGMEVVADFPGAEQALEWLERDSADLLVTDLTMPGSSGFELIRTVKDKYAALETVVLTCHQDFQYIQHALRLGAIDYIVKTELDDDKLDQLFGRIAERMAQRRQTGHSAPRFSASMCLFIGLDPECSVHELYAAADTVRQPVPVAGNAWFAEELQGGSEEEMAARLGGRWAVVRFRHMLPLDRPRIRTLLEAYVNRHSFYTLTAGGGLVHDSFQDIRQREARTLQDDWMRLWNGGAWLYQEEAYNKLLERIEAVRPDPAAVVGLIRDTVRSWTCMERWTEGGAHLDHVLSLQIWKQFREWLPDLRRSVRLVLDASGLDKEIALRMLNAIAWSRERLGEGITQEEAAGSVHLSRGYFSDCFKRATGTTFHDFMRMLRLDRAKQLLAAGDLPVQEVAAECGFADESYFRKLFRADCGKTPRAFREDRHREYLPFRWPPACE